jgi:hypothetical protein
LPHWASAANPKALQVTSASATNAVIGTERFVASRVVSGFVDTFARVISESGRLKI